MATSSPYPSMPLPFIMTDDSGRFHINKDTAQVLGRIEKPLVVVAIAGKYRTGKSFLMNRLAAEEVNPVLNRHKMHAFVTKRSEGQSSRNHTEEADEEEFADVRSMVKCWSMRVDGQFEQKQPKARSALPKPLQTREIGVSSTMSGFSLGNTVQSHTKGIWIWPVRHPRDERKCLLLLDTEGLGDVEKANEEHDIWLFVMAVLLSNILVYNTVGTLDHSGLEQLLYVKDMAQYVQARVGSRKDNPKNLDKYFPSLIICVRDFTLTLKLNGSPCTADDYMEHCFKIRKPENQRGREDENKSFNKERDIMCHYFKKRKCFMFPMPVNSEDLSKLENIPDRDLKPDFLKVANEFTSHIHQEVKYKNIDGVILTGQLFLQVAELYVAAQRSGDMVCIENTRVQVVQLANLQAVEDAKELYLRKMEVIEVQFPLKISQLHRHHEGCMDKALDLFYSHAVLDQEHKHEKELMEHMKTTFLKLGTQNKQRSQETCRIRLKKLYCLVDETYQGFMQPGGFRKYQAMMKKIEEDYYKTTGLGDEPGVRVLPTGFFASGLQGSSSGLQVDEDCWTRSGVRNLYPFQDLSTPSPTSLLELSRGPWYIPQPPSWGLGTLVAQRSGLSHLACLPAPVDTCLLLQMETMYKEFLEQKKESGNAILIVDKTLTSFQQQDMEIAEYIQQVYASDQDAHG
ncbi:guanylate-binding protein 1-like isoform X4 [Lethenteron reissneri]|uniref:guanylate-binding protein 1-like isoform X4 n=1 Tax=Lethenteron reissneri TaxID=7753 RepID=UPI002AB7BB14|nr:guanylate-binding protein 1-like isoform X4 [Lethenteron reissneri]